MALAPPPSQPNLHLLRNQLSPPDSGQVHDSLLASPPRGLVPGLTHPQPAYSPAGSASFQHLPGLQGHGLSAGSDCQLMSPPPAFHPAPARALPLPPATRPSYQPMQHNLAYNGQSSLPMSAGSSPAYERMTYQPDPAASHPLGLGMVYHPPTLASGSAPPSTLGQSLHSHAPPHQHSLGYHCPGVPQVPSPTHPMAPPPSQLQHSLGYHSGSQSSASCPSPTTSPLSMAPSPSQLQHSLGYHSGSQSSASYPSPTTSPLPMAPPPSQMQHSLGYHSGSQSSASCPSPTTSPLPMGLSSCSGPSSPQLHSLPYRSPTGSTPSPTPSSPLMHQPSPSAVSPLGHTLAPQPPFAPDGERPSIKQEPEDKEPTFRSIGLQDITLDDVNEIIGRDMSRAPGPQS